MKEEKKLNLPQSLLLLVLIIFSVAVCIRLKTGGPMIGLFASWIFIYLVCKIVRIPYDNVVAGAYDAIRMVVPTLCLLMACYDWYLVTERYDRDNYCLGA